jgi:tellurite resistance protein
VKRPLQDQTVFVVDRGSGIARTPRAARRHTEVPPHASELMEKAVALVETRADTETTGGGRFLPVIPPNFFGISFGLAGLAEVWTLASPTLGLVDIVGRVLALAATSVWVTLVVIYSSKGVQRIQEDWRNPILSPFLALVLIVPTLLAGLLCDVTLSVGRVLVAVLSSITIAVGGWSTGQWIVNDLYDECMHPGYLLPTATGGLVGSIAASDAHLHLLANAWFGVGMVSWLLVGSIILNRLFIRPRVSPALTPTLALEAGPPMVAGVAYHALQGGSIDTFASALGGYAILMVLVQLRLTPIYLRLSFTPAFWSFTFPTAAIGLDGIQWLETTRPTGFTAYTATVLGFVTLVIGGVAIRSVVALSRHQFFPPNPPVVPLQGEVPNSGLPDAAF